MPNGLTLLGQQMEQVASAAATFVVPAGTSHDPADAAGASAVIAEWLLRGAGDRDSRQLNDALDSLGCQHNENVQSEHIQCGTAQLGRNLGEVLPIYADILRRPRLEDASFEPCRDLTVQDLVSLEDEPAQKCNLMLRERFYPAPLGRCPYGTIQTLQGMRPDAIRSHAMKLLGPSDMLLSVAGAFEWNQLCDDVERCFGDWAPSPRAPLPTTPPAGGVLQVTKDSAQSHIALAYPSVTVGDSRYYAARIAETVLSGGMSGRLFTEVREKRGLVYHVSARYHSLRSHAGMFAYAGTTPEKAQQTLEVTVGELRRLAEGIGEDEMARARTQLKSALVMQGESTGARANTLASDWYHLGRLRSLEEISHAIDRTTVADVLACLKEMPARNLTILTIGPKPLDTATIGQ